MKNTGKYILPSSGGLDKSDYQTRVLVANDCRLSSKMLSVILEKHGYEVILARDGLDAIEMYTSTRPDMVIMDILMPRMNGYEATRYIKSHCEDRFVPVLFLTGLTDNESLRQAVNAGGDDFLSKPLVEEVVIAKLEALNRIRFFYDELHTHKQSLEKYQQQQQRELELAEHLFRKIIDTGTTDIKGLRSWVSSASVFCGDLLLNSMSPTGKLHILLGDFTGHGLTAAIGALPASEIFYGMTKKGISIEEILVELNKKLYTLLPSNVFCASVIFELNIKTRELRVWNGGLPPVYLLGGKDAPFITIDSTHTPLGVLDENTFDTSVYSIQLNGKEKIYAYTDGLTDARNQAGEKYGSNRFEAKLKSQGDVLEPLQSDLENFMGSCEQLDDISLLEIDCRKIVD